LGNNELLVSEDEWTFTDKEGKEVELGKSLIVWKIEDGKCSVITIILICQCLSKMKLFYCFRNKKPILKFLASVSYFLRVKINKNQNRIL
jgi:hypothetical protein